jgi:DNA repair protein RadA/Sms
LECGAWGSLEVSAKGGSAFGGKSKNSENVPVGNVINFSEISGGDFIRIKTGIGELDQVLGGGIVAGSLILLGGEPGIGKSTLVAQLAATLKNSTLYVSGEESAEQIKMRLDRLKLNTTSLKFLGETNIDVICKTVGELKPNIAIIDSIQTMATTDLPSEAGNVSQVRACTVKLLEVAKKITFRSL